MRTFVRSNARLIVAAVVGIAASACASRTPTPPPWLPGSYQFQASIHGETILGVIEVNDDGPFYVETSLSRCEPRLSENYKPWDRRRTFDCAGDHRVVVGFGTREGVPLAGTMSNTTQVTQEVRTSTCVKTAVDEEGVTQCVETREDVRKEVKPVTETARILINSGPTRGR
jgi:hypothetical protein